MRYHYGSIIVVLLVVLLAGLIAVFTSIDIRHSRQQVNDPDFLVYSIDETGFHDVEYYSRDDATFNGLDIPVLSLDSLSIIDARRAYQVGSYVVNIDKPGLYRILSYKDKLSSQFIVYNKDTDHPDILMSALSNIFSHGNKHDHLSYSELLAQTAMGRVFLTCGNVSVFAKNLLNEIGVKNRIVTTLSMDDWNEYDNGHTMIEVFDESANKWILYDLSSNVYFKNNNKRLSFLNFFRNVQNGAYELYKLAHEKSYRFSAEDNFSFDFYAEYVHGNEKNLHRWYKRMLGAIGIRLDDVYYFKTKGNQEMDKRIESYSASYKVIDAEVFKEKFYKNID